jgi:hypothetical protein
MTANFTPGPWIVNTWTTGRRTIEALNGLVICEVHNTHDGNEAHARLIAAAPQLLEALKLMTSIGDAYINICRIEGHSADNAAAVLHLALAAIKAAVEA